MAHIWIQQPEGTDWGIFQLTAAVYGIVDRLLTALGDSGCGPDDHGPPAMLVRRTCGSLERWFLLARKGAHIRVNGEPVVLGARLLCDRDEIIFHDNGAEAVLHGFFSTERRGEAIVFAGEEDGNEVHCPRCQDRIRNGQTAIRCPNPDCGVLHHQDEPSGLLCWTYAGTCALCSQATALDAGYKWTPEEL
jgi:hypothetical protein